MEADEDKGRLRPLYKSDGGRRGPAALSLQAPPESPWIACTARLPVAAPGCLASFACFVRDRDDDTTRAAQAYYRPDKACWLGLDGKVLAWSPTHWAAQPQRRTGAAQPQR